MIQKAINTLGKKRNIFLAINLRVCVCALYMMLVRHFWWRIVWQQNTQPAQWMKPNGKYLMEIQERQGLCALCMGKGKREREKNVEIYKSERSAWQICITDKGKVENWCEMKEINLVERWICMWCYSVLRKSLLYLYIHRFCVRRCCSCVTALCVFVQMWQYTSVCVHQPKPTPAESRGQHIDRYSLLRMSNTFWWYFSYGATEAAIVLRCYSLVAITVNHKIESASNWRMARRESNERPHECWNERRISERTYDWMSPKNGIK